MIHSLARQLQRRRQLIARDHRANLMRKQHEQTSDLIGVADNGEIDRGACILEWDQKPEFYNWEVRRITNPSDKYFRTLRRTNYKT